MGCDKPLTAYRSKIIGTSGKRGITFNRNASHSGVKIEVPCGRCIGCRLEHSRQWAMRCVHEKGLHDENTFLTLTYDNEHLPANSSLVRSHPQLFLKRLRFALAPKSIRFYGCGEYGDLSLRPHYHLIIFGHDFADKKFYKPAGQGQNLYTSEFVSKYWDCGFNVIGEVNFKTCAYVARYVTGKISGDKKEDHYGDRIPEFSMMSRRPGIGMNWFKKYGAHAYEFDSVIMNGKEVRPPRFYDTQFEVVDSTKLVQIKRKRRRKALAGKADNTSARRYVKTEVLRLNMLKREFK